MSYGLPYMGSKSRICDWLMANLPSAETFVDLFAGGCAVTHAALLSGRYKRVIANDIQGDVVELFQRAITTGLNQDDYAPISRDEFFLRAPHDALVRLVWSFGNRGDTYLYGEDIEKQMLAIHALITDCSLMQRYAEWHHVVTSGAFRERSRLDLVQSVASLVRISEISKSKRFSSCLFCSSCSYELCHVPKNSVVYADPPYSGTASYNGNTFDNESFYNYLRNVPFPVYVSEYTMPDDFVCINATDRTDTFSAVSSECVTERLFLHERFATRNENIEFNFDPQP